MKSLSLWALCLAAVMMLVTPGLAQKKLKPEKSEPVELTCPVSGRAVPAKNAPTLKHGGGKVGFCCKRCPEAFKKAPEKFVAKANQQLVESGQFEQTGCPISGNKVAKNTEIPVGETKVGFCCKRCKKAATESKTRIELVFGEKNFEKAFSKVEEKKKDVKKKKGDSKKGL